MREHVRVAAAIAMAAILATPAAAAAERVHRAFSGIITDASLGILFPEHLSVGQSYHGSFTIDLDAALVSLENEDTVATYQGAFDVSIEGVTFDVYHLRVWSSGPSGADDGFELAFEAGIAGGFLSLRSSQDLYSFPEIPTSVDVAEMDALALVSAVDHDPLPPHLADGGSITYVPEPARVASALAAVAALAARWRSRSRQPRGRREEA
jgi:hypothetical protein